MTGLVWQTLRRFVTTRKHQPSMLIGVDGCRNGWLAVFQDGDFTVSPEARIFFSFAELMEWCWRDALVTVDMPIGLKSAGSGSDFRRRCDMEARRKLGAKAASVFFAPLRELLDQTSFPDHPAACAWSRSSTGKGLSLQSYHLLPKIREVDHWLQAHPASWDRVMEVHPEVAFAHWAAQSGEPLPPYPSKKSPAGRTARQILIEQLWPGSVQRTREGLKNQRLPAAVSWGTDDLHDAFAALWTAHRVAAKKAVSYPPHLQAEDIDMTGLPMRIMA